MSRNQLTALLATAALSLPIGCNNNNSPADAGPTDSGTPPGQDAGGVDAGFDAGLDAGFDGGTGDGGLDAGLGDGGPIMGTLAFHYVSETGTTDVTPPAATLAGLINALVIGTDGGFASYPATPTDAGQFVINGVPAGEYYLQLGNTFYVVTSSRTLDLSSARLGRTNVASPDAGTTLTLNIPAGVQPWTNADTLVLASAGSGLATGLVNFFATSGLPDAGDTSITNEVIDYTRMTQVEAQGGLIDTLAGDVPVLYQLHQQTNDAGIGFLGAGPAYPAATLVMTDGTNTNITAAPFQPAITTASESFIFNGTAFEALRTQVNPNAQVFRNNIGLSALPGVSSYGVYLPLGGPELIVSNPASGTNVTFSATIPDPLPQAVWTTYGFAEATFNVPYQLGGGDAGVDAGAPLNVRGNIGYVDTSTVFNSGATIQPTISPVQSPLINGTDLFAGASGVGTSPTLSWTAPATGTASLYRITFESLSVDSSGNTVASSVRGQIYTQDTSVTVPPGVLTAGKTYLVRITAASIPNYNFAQAPFITSLPEGTADALSGPVTP